MVHVLQGYAAALNPMMGSSCQVSQPLPACSTRITNSEQRQENRNDDANIGF